MTNRGPAFTKGKEEPSDVKEALIDRSVALFVRTLGSNTHSDEEFENNLLKPEVQKKVSAFRLLTCLMGLTKLFLFRQPYFKPDMAYAQRLYDQWDNGDKGLAKAYGLPGPTPRRNQKRIENLSTLTVLNAVAEVFFFKQTAIQWECSQLDEQGECKPFDIKMLWNVVMLLQPTPEIIHNSWVMGLEYSIGTSAMGINTMTCIVESLNFRQEDLFRKPPDLNVAGLAMRDDEVASMESHYKPPPQPQGDGSDNPPPPPPPRMRVIPGADKMKISEYEKTFHSHDSYLAHDDAVRMLEQLRLRRESVSKFRHKCAETGFQNKQMDDPAQMCEAVLGKPMISLDEPEIQEVPMVDLTERTAEEEGAAQAEQLGPPPPVEERTQWHAWHRRMAQSKPGACNCPFSHVEGMLNPDQGEFDAEQNCPYCRSADLAPQTVGSPAELTTSLSPAASQMWPTVLTAALFYLPQTLAQWSMGYSAFLKPGADGNAGTRPGLNYTTKGSQERAKKNLAWIKVETSKKFDGWGQVASWLLADNKSNKTAGRYDFHFDGLKDCLYMLSTRSNSRKCPEMPNMGSDMGVDDALLTQGGDSTGSDSLVAKINPFKIPGKNGQFDKPEDDHDLMRHVTAQVENTMLQRKMDTLMRAGRLPALNVLNSNVISVCPPVKLIDGEVHVNIGVVDAHWSLVGEASLKASTIPGLKNRQERFCHNQPGPVGLSAPRLDKGRAAGKRPTAEASAPAAKLPENANTVMPSAYDLVSNLIAFYTAEMLYDDIGEAQLAQAVQTFSNLGFNLTFDDLPHLTMRTLGFDENNRQLLSCKLKKEKNADVPFVETTDDKDDPEQEVSLDHVAMSMNRGKVTEEDRQKYIQRRQGSRSMRGVKGDIFAASTWLKHSYTSLSERGIIPPRVEGERDSVAYTALNNMTTCIQSRIIELASAKGYKKFKGLDLIPAIPRTYAALEKKAREDAPMHRPKRTKSVVNKHKDHIKKMEMACMPGLVDLDPMELEAPQCEGQGGDAAMADVNEAGPSGTNERFELRGRSPAPAE